MKCDMFRSRNKRSKFHDSFHCALGPVLVVGQCFGLMPIEGVLNPNHAYIKFRWTHFRTVLTLVNIISGALFLAVTMRIIILEGIGLRNIVGVIFFTCCTLTIILCLKMATKWQDIIRVWYYSEKSFVKQIYPAVGWPLAMKINFTSTIVFSLAIFLVVAQIFGIMPVADVLSSNLASINFKWTNFQSILTILHIVSGMVFASLLSYDLWKHNIGPKTVVGVVFFTCCTFIFIIFLLMAQKWVRVMKHWVNLEKKFLQSPYTIYGWTVRRRVRMASVLVLSLALVEHMLYIISNWYNMYFFTKTCNVTVDNWWHYYFQNNFVFMFSLLPYHFITTLYLEYSNFALTVGWNYMDLFIMLISIGISTRFKQFNQRLKMMCNKILPEKQWEQMRCDYVALCELVEYMDGNMAPLILLSCTNNLYFICFQLLNIFNSLPHTINKIYFWFSLLYLIGRTIFVYLCAAAIHDASKLPLEIIRSIPSDGWCAELERFAEQVRSELIALSGNKFFYLTRKLLFGIAGTVVTYELVLLQFDYHDFGDGSNTNSTNSTMCIDKY